MLQPATQDKLRAFFGSRRFELGITTLIAVNALLLAAETAPSIETRYGGLINALNTLILVAFLVELSLKIAAFGRAFWREPWNWFDLAVVLVSIPAQTEAFGALRAFRALRLLRLLTIVPSLRRVVEGLVKAIPGLGSIMVLLILLLFVFSVMGTRLFGEAHPEHFGTLGSSAFSLFSVMTLEGWPDLAREVMKTHPLAWAFFILFIMLSSWAVLNLVIGVIVDSMASHAREHEEEVEQMILKRQGELLDELQSLRREVAALRETTGQR